MQEELQQHRKTLRVALGPSQPPPPPPKAAGSGAQQRSSLKHGAQQQQQQGQQGGGGGMQPPQQQQQNGEHQQNGTGGSGTLADTVKNNPVISKYFSVRSGGSSHKICMLFLNCSAQFNQPSPSTEAVSKSDLHVVFKCVCSCFAAPPWPPLAQLHLCLLCPAALQWAGWWKQPAGVWEVGLGRLGWALRLQGQACPCQACWCCLL